jgi:hypothetical protein
MLLDDVFMQQEEDERIKARQHPIADKKVAIGLSTRERSRLEMIIKPYFIGALYSASRLKLQPAVVDSIIVAMRSYFPNISRHPFFTKVVVHNMFKRLFKLKQSSSLPPVCNPPKPVELPANEDEGEFEQHIHGQTTGLLASIHRESDATPATGGNSIVDIFTADKRTRRTSAQIQESKDMLLDEEFMEQEENDRMKAQQVLQMKLVLIANC